MEVSKRQIWVTSVLSDDDVGKALVLCHSLKMTFTSRPVAVIMSGSLQSHFRKMLKAAFDLAFFLDDVEPKEKLVPEDFAKIFAISSLKLYDKAVYVSPSLVALHNPDGIFEECEDNGFSGFILPEKGTSVFVFKPSLEIGQSLFDGFLHLAKEMDFEDYLKTWIKHQSSGSEEGRPVLKEKYNRRLQPGCFIPGDGEDAVFVNLHGTNPQDVLMEQNLGHFEKQVLDFWRKVFNENVKPLLDGKMTSSLTTSLYPKQYKTEPIAIVGMSCRYPGSNNLIEFWNLIFNGEDGTCTPPPFRWLREQSCLHKPEYHKTNAGFIQVPVDTFDSKFFGVSPKEVDFMDPQLRLVYELVWEALEDACIDPHSLKGTPGSVFLGSWLNDFKDILMHSGKREFFRTYMCNSIGAAAARISHFLDITGPSIATESGCSSAMVAVHLACKSLRSGETNLALACGVNLLLHPFDKDVMPMVIAPDGHCKTFSEDADGFARGEGCGVLVLKRLSDAVRDKDDIWGLIRGSAMVQEGTSKSMGTPTVECEATAMSRALQDANVRPEEVSFIETHGTGTPVGDPLEVTAIAKSYHSENRKKPLLIGSVKTNVGHTESCSGITGIMKVVLALKNELIPAHRNFSKLNPDIDLDSVPAVIPFKAVEWKRNPGQPRLAGVSSFGITGTDAHVIIEESPEQLSNPINLVHERPLHILKLSAKTEEALDALMKNFADTLLLNSHSFPDICFSANVGRANFPCRAVLIAKSKEEGVQLIQQNKVQRATISGEVPKICFLFTGQGSQYPGMAKELYKTCPIFQMHFDFCHEILMEKYKIDIKKVLWESSDPKLINKSVYSQTSIFCVEYALQKLWEFWGVKPDFVLGHSLGEFAAAVCAGILSFNDAIKLVAERSLLIESLPRGKMLVVRGSYQKVKSAMTQFAYGDKIKLLDFAAINSPEQTVLAGDSGVVEDFSRFCQDSFNMKCTVLDATHAFHSKHMDPILGKYKKIARSAKTSPSKCGYISGLKGKLVNGEEINEEYWVDHTRDKVNYLEASRYAIDLGCIFIEIGPQPVLSALAMTNTDKSLICLPSLKRKEENWNTILNSLGKLYLNGVNIDWRRFDQFYNRRKIHELPNHPFFGKKYWPSLNHTSSEAVHPLLGSSIPNPCSIKLYKSGIDLDSTHEFVADHAIGETVVFPGAAFIEICLAAGLAAIEDCQGDLPAPRRGMKIENFQIEAPLAIRKGKVCQIQTIVENSKSDTSDWNDLSVKVYQSLSGDSSSFLLHAKATYLPLLSEEENNISRAFEAERFQSILETPGNSEIPLKVYEKLNTVGLKFGPAFKSVGKIWKGKEDKWILAKLKEIKTEDGYLLHPVIIDAMMQTAMMLKADSKDLAGSKKLYVPVKIGKFIWLAKNQTYTFYAHAFEESKNSALSHCKVLLLNGNGNVLAEMSDIEFMETTAKSIEAIIDQQTTTMPGLWEEVWRPQLGPMQHRADLKLCNGINSSTDEAKQLFQECNTLSTEVKQTLRDLDYFVYLNILKSLYECGLEELCMGFEFNEEEMRKQLKIKDQFHKLFAYFLKILIEEGILKKMRDNYKIIKSAPNVKEILRELDSPKYSIQLVDKFKSAVLLNKVGVSLSKILTGEVEALSILFPETFAQAEENSQRVADFYKEMGIFSKTEKAVRDSLSMWLKHWKSIENGKQIMRIIEFGAGTGSYTGVALELLEYFEVEFEYTYTDISSAFFTGAGKKFAKWGKSITYKTLNIEADPISQGFIPEYYDFAVASHVIHATKDVKESLQHVKTLLKTFGRFDIMEVTSQNRITTYLFGVLEGYWRFTDFELRPTHTTLTIEKWVQTLNSVGLKLSEMYPCQNDGFAYISSTKREIDSKCPKWLNQKELKTWLVFHQDDCIISEYLRSNIAALPGREVVTIRRKTESPLENSDFRVETDNDEDFKTLFNQFDGSIEGIIYAWSLDQTSSSQKDILQPFIHLAKSITSLKQRQPRLVTLFSGISPIPDNDFNSVAPSTIWGFAKSWRNEITQINCKCVDVGPLKHYENNKQTLWQIFYEIWNNSGKNEMQVAYSGLVRYIPKFQFHKPTLNNLRLPKGTNRFELLLPESKSISDLEFIPSKIRVLEETDVEVKVEAYALNFRDVFSVLKPAEELKDVKGIGYDFAGVVVKIGSEVKKWKIGDRVFGININNEAMPSHVKINQENLHGIGDVLTFTEAVTLPVVFITAYYCLEKIAKVTARDTVLIHTASGGVGLASIQICKYLGAKIICTAGSSRKRRYLKSIGMEYIFNSRDTKFENKILEITSGRGVDVVLNTLTSDGFKEASLNCCAKGAKFVEISKLQIWTTKEVQKRRPDVEYSIVDVAAFTQDSNKWRGLMESFDKTLKDSCRIQPLPYVAFQALNIREALKYLAKAEHIGKVVVKMPEINQTEQFQTKLFHERGTYLITGGLGGIGFAVCKWMLEQGASYIVLAGRNSPTSTLATEISQLNSKYNSKILSISLDIGNFESLKSFLRVELPCLKFPPIKGIMHCAGVLNDDLFHQQEWSEVSKTLNAKVEGTLNLHELTKECRLDFFVMFSSTTSLFGSPAQSSYAAGNHFENSFAHHRHSLGLPATTINWGQWGEVGLATEIDIPGIRPLSTSQGLAALEYALNSHKIQLAAINIHSFAMISKFIPTVSSYLDPKIWKRESAMFRNSIEIKPEEFWGKYDALLSLEEKNKFMKEQICCILRNTLKLEITEVIPDEQDFREMGVDSLMLVEMKNSLQNTFGDRVTINPSVLRDCTNVLILAQTLVKVIEGSEDFKIPTDKEVSELIKEDCVLAETIRANEDQFVVDIDKVSCILLTGASGTLGPYILKELSMLPQITEIVCLMRPHKTQTPYERLLSVLENRGILEEIDLKKVSCVSGNVTDHGLGIEEEAYNILCDKIDAVFHLAAKIQHLEHYRKESKTPGNDSRAVNITGVKNILQFCTSSTKLKHIFYSGSIVTAAKLDKEETISEDWPEMKDFEGITTFAYPITKFVGDVLLKEALTKRGIPGKLIRFPNIIGDKDGRFVLENNHMMLRILYILKTQMITDNPLPLCTLPVDVCAKTGVELFLKKGCEDGLYNVFHDKPELEQKLVPVAKELGFHVDIVDFPTFAEMVRNSTLDDSPLVIFKDLYGDNVDKVVAQVSSNVPCIKQWLVNGGCGNENFFRSGKLLKYIPDFYDNLEKPTECLKRDLLYARKQGWLKKYGLE